MTTPSAGGAPRTILELAKGYREKKFSVSEIVKHTFAQIQSDTTNSVITAQSLDHLLAQAKSLDAQKFVATTPLLAGVPLGIKDNIVTKNLRTTCASKILEQYVPPYSADVVNRLNSCNAIISAKLNLDEFAMGGSNENSAFGAVKNPVDSTRVPGGSSGGSAAAVKAGLVAASLGSDTGGSIRLPASYCGLVGIKPTYGLVSRYGLVAFGSSLDQIGPLTHTVDDAAIMLSALCGRNKNEWEQDSTTLDYPQVDYLDALKKQQKTKLRVGVLSAKDLANLQPEIASALQNTYAQLTRQGHSLVEIALPHAQYSIAVYYVIAVAEVSTNLSRFDGVRFGARVPGQSIEETYKKTRALFGDEVKRRIILGTFALSSGYYDAYYKKACQVRALIAQDYKTAFSKCDVILNPVSSRTAFKIGEIKDPLALYLNDMFTIPANLAGLPALSVPAGRDGEGLPIGLQFTGPACSESLLLSCAKLVETHVHQEPGVHYEH